MKTENTVAAVDAVVMAALAFVRERVRLVKNGNYQIPDATDELVATVTLLEQAAMADALAQWHARKEAAPEPQ